MLLCPPAGLETLTDVRTARGAGSPMSFISLDSSERAAANDRGGFSGGGPKISCPLSSLHLASDNGFLIFASESATNVPLSSRCFATSGTDVGFLGVTLSSVLKEIWLIPLRAC
uniref:Uncharacterized protein n=1 Tax=Opuntia streptacantha TaxID=393608 RepID=A0A7C9CW08_OPUST